MSTAQMTKLARTLFPEAERQELFTAAIGSGAAPALLWLSERPSPNPFCIQEPVSWQPDFVDRLKEGARPGSSAWHEQGACYCLDLSSAFCASVLFGAAGSRVLDMCAAPGGKTVFASRLIRPMELVANEVIGKRRAALAGNIARCKLANVQMTGRDPKEFAEFYRHSFDIVIVDAPCSGQSLINKGTKAVNCFHPAVINMNSNRQKRIVACSAEAVKPGGFLAYMTCTFSRDENEGVVAWLLRKFPAFTALAVARLAPYQTHLADFPAYRLWPWQHEGAGGFAALLRHEIGDSSHYS